METYKAERKLSETEHKLRRSVDELMEIADEELGLRLSDNERIDKNLADAKVGDVIANVAKSAVRFRKLAEWHLSQGRERKYCINVLISSSQISSKVETCEG